jgi:hypothetical protein
MISLLAPVFAVTRVDLALVLLRLALLLAGVAATNRRPWSQGAAVAVLFALSFLARGAIAVLAFTVLVLGARALLVPRERRWEPVPATGLRDGVVGESSGTHAVLLAACALAGASLLVATARRPPPPLPEDAPSRTMHYRSVYNLHRAREAALQWAKEEGTPGPGYLNLAEIDWQLGEREKARKVLAKVKERATDPSAQSRAASLEAEWAAEDAVP